MIEKNFTLKKQIFILFAACFVFLLFGCGAAPEFETTQPTEQEIANADIENGEILFMGYAHFQNGAPPCMGCHNVGEYGLLGGGALGPDLTNVSTRLTETEILEILSNTGATISPVMLPIYADTPLTAQEQADLLAFMQASAGQHEADKELLVFGVSLAGVVIVIMALGFIYRNRLRGVRKALIKKAQAEHDNTRRLS